MASPGPSDASKKHATRIMDFNKKFPVSSMKMSPIKARRSMSDPSETQARDTEGWGKKKNKSSKRKGYEKNARQSPSEHSPSLSPSSSISFTSSSCPENEKVDSDSDSELDSLQDPLEMDGHSLDTESVASGEDTALHRSKHKQPGSRAEAITLLRARTLSRLSPVDASDLGESTVGQSDNNMVYEKASLMDFVTTKKGKNKNKKKKKKAKAKGKRGYQDAESSAAAAAAATEIVTPEHSKAQSSVSCKSGHRPNKDGDASLSGQKSEEAKVPEGKGKQRALIAGPDTEGETWNDAKPLPIRKKSDNTKASASTNKPRTPEKGKEKVSSSSPRQPSRRAPASTKDKLPSIREVSGEIHKSCAQDETSPSKDKYEGLSSESPVLHESTPKSSGTVSTAWTNTGAQFTPQTTEPSDTPLKGTVPHNDNVTVSVSVQSPESPSSQAIISTHAHPSPPPPSSSSSSSSSSASSNRPNNRQTSSISTQKPEGFFWQLDSHGFPCAKANCEKRCNLWDGATVICPRCGPFSETRYCSREHLLADIKTHWISCGEMVFRHPCRESSIPRDVRTGPPLIPCLHQYDTPERHRQAVHFNANARRGDYFIFADWAVMVEAGFPDDNLALRCSNRVVYSVVFTDPQEKDRFRRVLAACLFMTIEAHELVDYLFRLIRDKLRAHQTPPPPPDLETALVYQIHQEFAVSIQPPITGERHACETDWDGRNRRNCQDAVCRAEFRRLLGSLGGRGHERLLDHLEGTYWVLRAARTTHPVVRDSGARMRGEGFEEVAEEDRRVFRRGDGWDGAGSGEMEIEGINA